MNSKGTIAAMAALLTAAGTILGAFAVWQNNKVDAYNAARSAEHDAIRYELKLVKDEMSRVSVRLDRLDDRPASQYSKR